jgi:hypothetical protein
VEIMRDHYDLGIDSRAITTTLPEARLWRSLVRGHHEGLTLLGCDAEAGIIKQRLALANARTDAPVKSSRFSKPGSH